MFRPSRPRSTSRLGRAEQATSSSLIDALDPVVVKNLKEMLALEPEGKLFSDQVVNKYLQKFLVVLPPNWFTLVERSKEFAISEEMDILEEMRKVVALKAVDLNNLSLANMQLSGDAEKRDSSLNGVANDGFAESNNESAESSSAKTGQQLGKVEVPPGKTRWSVKVGKVVSASEVYVRFDEYEQQYSKLSQKLMMHYLIHPSPVGRIEVGYIYVAVAATKAARVEVISVGEKEVECRFIDSGFTHSLAMHLLHTAESEFIEVPAFAYPVALNMLEDVNSQRIVDYLDNYFKSRRNEFFTAICVARNDAKLTVELFKSPVSCSEETDESSINIKTIRTLYSREISEKFKQVGALLDVRVTHVSATGSIWVQLDDEYLHKLHNNQEIINQSCEEAIAPKSIVKNKADVYYAKCNGHWRRIVVSNETDPSIDVVFVDYGYESIILSNEIRRLDMLTDLNRALPFLAQNVRLSLEEGVNWTVKLSSRLLSFYDGNQKGKMIIEKSATNGSPPVVNLLKSVKNVLLTTQRVGHYQARCDDAFVSVNLNGNEKSVNSRPTTPLSENENTTRSSLFNDEASLFSGSDSTSPSNRSILLNNLIPKGVLPPPSSDPNCAVAFVDVFVSHIIDPHNFFVQRHASHKKLIELMKVMNECLKPDTSKVPAAAIEIGKHFAAYSSEDDKWYRVEVRAIEKKSPVTLSVFCVDYGNSFLVDLSDVRLLPYRFKTFPQQAIRAALAIEADGGTYWTPAMVDKFKKLTNQKALVARVKHVINEDQSLKVELVDTSTSEDVWIHREMKGIRN